MKDKLINAILQQKKSQIESLLRLTESPIEEIFILRFHQFLDSQIIGDEPLFHTISGYSYIDDMESYLFASQRKPCGILISYSQSIFNAEVNLPSAYRVKDPVIDKTVRKPGCLKRDSISFLYNQVLEVYPQYCVKAGSENYRLDFAFLLHEDSDDGFHLVNKVGIECDGFKFHTTPDQFRKDRERSRNLQAMNWKIIQFSGAELLAKESEFLFSEFRKIFKTSGFGYWGLQQ